MNDNNNEKALADLEARTEGLSGITFSAKQIRVIVAAIISAFVLSNGASGLGIWRFDKFGRTDFMEGIGPLTNRVSSLEIWRAKQNAKCDATRERIDHIEADDIRMEKLIRDHERIDEQRFRDLLNRGYSNGYQKPGR